MLVLSRKVDQMIVIQGNITIKVLEISGDRVKIGINAPRDVVVLRQELTEEALGDTVSLPVSDGPSRSEAD
ncbi:MAG: carbon storage regulator [Chloroflexota bacterium]